MTPAGEPDDPQLLEPVRRLPVDRDRPPEEGTALCLSGGGYRAMLFHAGVLRRLNDAAMLRRLDRISSVSGGSITAGVLGLAWDRLDFDEHGRARAFAECVEEPVRALSRQGIDLRSVVTGALTPGPIAGRVAAAYRRHLFGKAKLADLPERPRFIINATNMGSGSLVRFQRDYLADWRVGRVLQPDVELAVAVACSSAFPPFLSPYRLDLKGARWQTDPGNTLTGREHREALVLSDGGVYDNLGLETAWKRCRTVLVSDAGGQLEPEAAPKRDWVRHTARVLLVIDAQVRALRKRQVIDGFRRGDRDGAYLGIRSDIADYGLADPLPAPHAHTLELADMPTRLDKVAAVAQERLINWGYAICDAALRRHVDPSLPRPDALPHPVAGVGG
jgi:NTE family protein